MSCFVLKGTSNQIRWAREWYHALDSPILGHAIAMGFEFFYLRLIISNKSPKLYNEPHVQIHLLTNGLGGRQVLLLP
jgi:hypothetical protein